MGDICIFCGLPNSGGNHLNFKACTDALRKDRDELKRRIDTVVPLLDKVTQSYYLDLVVTGKMTVEEIKATLLRG